jgi:ATP-dependent Clp protease ATP-binding subunit ClpC
VTEDPTSTLETGGPEDESPEQAVRRVAEMLEERYFEPDPEELDADQDFLDVVRLIAAGDVDLAIPARLAVDQESFVAAIGLRALRDRREAPPNWERRAFRHLRRAGSGQIAFLLDALAAVAHRPVLADVLPLVDSDWLEEPARDAFRRFATFRKARGDKIEAGAFARLGPGQDALLAQLVEGEDEGLRPLREGLAAWRESRIDVDFFRTFARVVDAGTAERTTAVGGRARAIETLLDALGAEPPRSVLLVGDEGVGKTSVALEALRELEGWFVFEAGASDVIAGQHYIGQIEGRIREIADRTKGRRILWLFPRFEEAFWAGQWSRNPNGIIDAILPLVEAGEVLIAGEVTPAGYELLTRLRPKVGTLFEVARLREPDEGETLQVARDWLAADGEIAVSEAALREAYDLATHYLGNLAPPGNLLRLLRMSADRARDAGLTEVGPDDVITTLGEATGLPLDVLNPRIRMQLADVRAFFTERVLGQPEAVDCLVERIAMIKAGLTDPTRPLGVFLFVGPTGTGKTELAKGLAEFLFGSSDRLVRLDMSEFQTPESLERLLRDNPVEPGAALISSVRRQPFSVVLLDEFEKAHPNVWNVFLQLFDDGRLTDQNGRTADFRQCVVILTCNIGSAIPRGPGMGFAGDSESFDPSAVERELARSFRPELLNRLDRVVVFRPLEREVMRSILHHELRSLLARRGFRAQPWAVEWDDAALDFLLERGFSAELGARPLKRAVEQYLLAPLAATIVEHQVPEGDQFLFIGAGRDRIEVTFIDPDADVPRTEPAPTGSGPARLEELVAEPRGDTAEVAFLRDELARIEARRVVWAERKTAALGRMRESDFWEAPERHGQLGLVEYLDRLDAAARTAAGLLARLEDRVRKQAPPPRKIVGLLAERAYLLDRALTGLERGDPPDAVVRAAGDDEQADRFAAELLGMYDAWARLRGMRVRELPGRALVVTGLGAFTILAAESGLHVLELPVDSRVERAAVRVTVAPLPFGADADPVEERALAALAGVPPPATVVRRYRYEPSPLVRDSVRGWRTGRIDRVLGGGFDVVV